MVYGELFVMSVIVDGKIQKELKNGTVLIPFGKEYELRFRNKHDRRAVVKIFIDGENVSGNGYVIDRKSCINIKRHAHADAAFKLVPLDSSEAADAGKNRSNEDKQIGTIEARFYLEKTPPVKEVHHYHYQKKYIRPWEDIDPWKWPTYPKVTWEVEQTKTVSSPTTWSSQLFSSGNSEYGASFNCCNAPTYNEVTWPQVQMPSVTEDAATVEGSRTGQTFGSTYIDLESHYVSLKLFLQGYRQGHERPHVAVSVDLPKESPEQENARLKREIEEAKKNNSLEEENRKLREELAKLKASKG